VLHCVYKLLYIKPRKTSISLLLDKISKIWLVTFLALIWEIYTENLGQLPLKLREEFEVTDRPIDSLADKILGEYQVSPYAFLPYADLPYIKFAI